MKSFKKLLALLMTAVIVFSLAACGSGSTAKTEEKETTETAENTEDTAAADTAEAAETSGSAIDKIVFGTNPEFPPFEFISSTGGIIEEYDGIDIAIVKQIGEDLGADVSINSMEFDSLLIALGNGQIDAVIAGMTVTEERLKSVNFTTPYYTATQVMIVKEDSDIQKATDMEGKTIAVIQGYTGEVSVQKLGYEYESFKKGTDAIMELMNGKADVVVIDSATAQKYVNDNKGLKIVEDNEEFESEEYAIAVNKDNPELLETLNAEIEKMLSSGLISDLAAQYAVAE